MNETIEQLNAIPRDKTERFPTGVSEVKYATWDLMQAFLNGLGYADDVDVEHSEIFERNGEFVVRVKVGDFEDESDTY